MLKTCKENGLANGLCLWGAGLVASVMMATSSQAFFNGDNDSHILSEAIPVAHYNFSNNGNGKFKLSVEAEGEALMLGVGDGRSELTNDMKTSIQDYAQGYPKNYWD